MKMKKMMLSLIMLSGLVFGATKVEAMSYDTFFGGVTGVTGWGTTYAEFHPKNYRWVYVTARGKSEMTGSAYSGGKAFARVERAWSGNKAWWGA